MKTSIILAVLLFTGCATFDTSVPIEKRIQSAQITLQAVEDVVPELVASGDLAVNDAQALTVAIDRAQELVNTADMLASKELPQDAISQLGLAIETLRAAQNHIDNEKTRQNTGRAIAALVLTKSILEQESALK